MGILTSLYRKRIALKNENDDTTLKDRRQVDESQFPSDVSMDSKNRDNERWTMGSTVKQLFYRR